MKYVSLDLETMGVNDRGPDRILMISMVAEDTEYPEIPVEQLPHFTAIIKQPKIIGETTACAMNAWIFVAIEFSETKMTEEKFFVKFTDLGIPSETVAKGIQAAKSYKVLTPVNAEYAAEVWLNDRFGTKDKITVAGKNVAGFDMTFLPEGLKSRFRHSVIDPGSVFWNPSTDRMLPHSAEVMKRAGVKYEGAHDALADARMMISALRNHPYYLLERAKSILEKCKADGVLYPGSRTDIDLFVSIIPEYLRSKK